MSNVTPLRPNMDQTLEEAFPVADAGWLPFGDRVVVQLRTPKKKTAGGIILTAESKDYDKWATTVARVVSLGPLAFRNRTTGEPWPEGIWANVGDFVRCPKWGGDRWEVSLTQDQFDNDNVARFAVFRDHEIICGLKNGNHPLSFKDYV